MLAENAAQSHGGFAALNPASKLLSVCSDPAGSPRLVALSQFVVHFLHKGLFGFVDILHWN